MKTRRSSIAVSLLIAFGLGVAVSAICLLATSFWPSIWPLRIVSCPIAVVSGQLCATAKSRIPAAIAFYLPFSLIEWWYFGIFAGLFSFAVFAILILLCGYLGRRETGGWFPNK